MPLSEAKVKSKRAWRAMRKQKALDYLGGACAVCGTTDNLEFDHIDPTTKVSSIGLLLSNSWTTLQEELDKCQVLCTKHHREKTNKQFEVPHGGGKAGKKDCKCEPCREVRRPYDRARYYRKTHPNPTTDKE